MSGCTTYGSTPSSNSPTDIVLAIKDIYDTRYSTGMVEGTNDGYNRGYKEGYSVGYKEGTSASPAYQRVKTIQVACAMTWGGGSSTTTLTIKINYNGTKVSSITGSASWSGPGGSSTAKVSGQTFY